MRTMLRSLCILRFLMRKGGSAAESFIQSGIYMLQEAAGEELGCVFYLDSRGPRSREVFENLLVLQSEGKVSIEGGREGFTIKISDKGSEFICKGGEWGGHFYDLPPVRIPEKMIDSILGLPGADELNLETMGLACYISRSTEGTDFLELIRSAKREGFIAADVDEREVLRSYKKLRKAKLGSG